MANLMKHEGYIAKIEFDPEIGKFFGEVVNTSDVITFYGSSVDELQREFANSLKAHVEFCRKRGIEPSRPYSGKFNVRIDPHVHASVFAAAHLAGKSMNEWIAELLSREAFRVLEVGASSMSEVLLAQRSIAQRLLGQHLEGAVKEAVAMNRAAKQTASAGALPKADYERLLALGSANFEAVVKLNEAMIKGIAKLNEELMSFTSARLKEIAAGAHGRTSAGAPQSAGEAHGRKAPTRTRHVA